MNLTLPPDHTAAGRLWRTLLPVLAILLATALLYGHTLHAPWILDDQANIVENPRLRTLAWNPLLAARGLAYYSFALNYHFGGTDPFGYHLVNIAIHAGCGLLVLLLLRRIFPEQPLLSLLGALLFVAHPLQTQAVTYVVQRMTSLSALFCLVTLYLFARSREAQAAGGTLRSAPVFLPLAGALLAALCAQAVKENAAILPVALLLYSRFFSPGDRAWRPLLLSLSPFFVIALLLAGERLILPLLSGTPILKLTSTQSLTNLADNTPLRYLVTEFSVIWTYLRLIVLPFGQGLEHGYPLTRSLLSAGSLLAGGGLLLLGGLAWQLRNRRPRLSFGIVWFFLTLAVESSVIPLDPLYEHRLYLPLFGIVVIVLDLLANLPRKFLSGAAIVLLAVLGVLTWQRNRLWNDEIAFFADNIRHYPESERALTSYSSACINANRFSDGSAAAAAAKVLTINPDSAVAYRDLVRIRIEEGRTDEALALIEEAVRRKRGSALLFNSLAQIRINQQRPDLAREAMLNSLAHQKFPTTYSNLGVTNEMLGRFAEAETAYRTATRMEGADYLPFLNLAKLLARGGRYGEAAQYARAALPRSAPGSDPRREIEELLRQLNAAGRNF